MISLVVLSLVIIILSLVAPAALIIIVLIMNMLYINLKTLVPWAKVPIINLEKILAEINLAPGALVYDLGSGDGRFLFLAEKHGFKAVGYELAYYPYLKTLARKFLKGSKVEIKNKDFFKADLGQAEAIFIFLTAAVMEKIGLKLKENLKLGTKVISYGFAIPGWPVLKVLDTKPSKTYLYFN